METPKVIIEPDILITRIGALWQRDEKDISQDTVGLETRLRNLHALFNREASAAVSPQLPYDKKRDLVIRIGEEILALAEAGYESEAMQIAVSRGLVGGQIDASGKMVGGLGMCGGYMQSYFDLIPAEKRVEEFRLRESIEAGSQPNS